MNVAMLKIFYPIGFLIIPHCLQRSFLWACLLLLVATQVQAEQAQILASLESTSLVTKHEPTRNVDDILKQLELRLNNYPQDHEAQLLRVLVYFKAGDHKQALQELDELLKQVPDFHLAHLIRGDIILSRTAVLTGIGKNQFLSQLQPEQRTQLEALRFEADVRLNSSRSSVATSKKLATRLPRQILKLGKSVDYAVLVEKSTHRLYIYQRQKNKPPKLVQNYYVSTGKKEGNKNVRGDLRTPEGVYFITSWIPQEKLPDKYGVGAFPLNYPNELDRRRGKTGYGIWLHGTESQYYSRPPLDSEGCMVLTNIDFSAMKKEMRPGATPVVIVETVDWLSHEDWFQQRKKILTDLERWRYDWESLDVQRYLSHYSEEFWSKGHNLKSWSKRKRRIARNKSFQKIQLSDISILAYPESSTNKKDIVVARFQQDYQSSNYRSDVSKRLYLERNNDDWKIMYEGR